jgi:WD40 repeat protein
MSGGWASGPGGSDGSAWGLAEPGPDQSALDTAEADRYVAAGLIGVGGMGQVEAVRDLRLDREVARKVPSPRIDPEVGLALLAHEARVTARLDHPNVVAVHDAGRLPDGRRFFTMRLVRGQTLAAVAEAPARREDLPRLVRHLLDATRALAHAHAAGVVHADLKPSNILVGPYGETQVADWGLARFLDPAEPAPPFDAGAGTPPWRAPEVEAGEPPGPPADVYALGVILRDLIGDPDRAPVELVAVARRATAGRAADRYPDAAALGDDLAAWLDGRPVLAHAYTSGELVRRLVRAWRAPLAVAAAAAMVVGVVVVSAGLRTAAERDRAVLAEAALRETAASLWVDRAVTALRRDDQPEAVRAAREALALRPDPDARGVLAAFAAGGGATQVGEAPRPAGCGRVLRLDAAGALCSDGATVRRFGPDGSELHAWKVVVVDALAQGDTLLAVADQRIVDVDGAGQVRERAPYGNVSGLVAGPTPIYNNRTWLTVLSEPPVALRVCGDAESTDGVATAGDGRWWATCSEGRLVRGRGAEVVATVLASGPTVRGALALDVVADGAWLLAGRLDGGWVRLDGITGAVLAAAPAGGQPVRRIVGSPNGRWVATVDRDGMVRLWRAEDAAEIGRVGVGAAVEVAWTSDDELWVVGDTFARWRVEANAAPYRWTEHGGVAVLGVDAGGERVAVGLGGEVVVRRLPDGTVERVAQPHQRTVKAVGFLSTGDVVSASVDASAAMWVMPRDGSPGIELPGARATRRMVVLADDTILAAPYAPRFARWRTPSSTPEERPLARMVADLVAAPGATEAWSLDEVGELRRVDARTGESEVVGAFGVAGRLAVSGDGRVLVVVGDGEVVVLRGSSEIARWPVTPAPTAVGLDHAGVRIALGSLDGQVAVRQTADGLLLLRAPGHGDRVTSVVWLPDGGLVTGSWDRTVRRWRL